MAIVPGFLASFDDGASFVELMIDDADLTPGRATVDAPLAGARAVSARIVSSTLRGIWVHIEERARPNLVFVKDRGRIVGDLSFNFRVGRRITLADLSFMVGSE